MFGVSSMELLVLLWFLVCLPLLAHTSADPLDPPSILGNLFSHFLEQGELRVWAYAFEHLLSTGELSH